MAVESFWPYPKFSEETVFQTVGRAEPVRHLEPSRFEGPVAQWADERMRNLGETIVPRIVYVDQPPFRKAHRVAWVYHDGFNMETGEAFCMHHVACDCSPDVDRVSNPEEKQEIMSNCPALIPAIERQAAQVNAAYLIDEVLDGLSYQPDIPLEEQGGAIQHFVARSMVHLLEHDYRHPEGWIANIESGWTLTNLMAMVFRMRAEDIGWIADSLASQGVVDTDEGAMALSQELRDRIHAEKVLREVSNGFESDTA